MKYLGLLTLFLGYLLVYAATANHGRFATHPWLGLLADAYTGDVLTPRSSTLVSPEGPVPASPGATASFLQPANLLGAAA